MVGSNVRTMNDRDIDDTASTLTDSSQRIDFRPRAATQYIEIGERTASNNEDENRSSSTLTNPFEDNIEQYVEIHSISSMSVQSELEQSWEIPEPSHHSESIPSPEQYDGESWSGQQEGIDSNSQNSSGCHSDSDSDGFDRPFFLKLATLFPNEKGPERIHMMSKFLHNVYNRMAGEIQCAFIFENQQEQLRVITAMLDENLGFGEDAERLTCICPIFVEDAIEANTRLFVEYANRNFKKCETSSTVIKLRSILSIWISFSRYSNSFTNSLDNTRKLRILCEGMPVKMKRLLNLQLKTARFLVELIRVTGFKFSDFVQGLTILTLAKECTEEMLSVVLNEMQKFSFAHNLQ
ncbi:hypothetical protein HDV02_000175 [Globomyces sp. JEL0801]|nr:hypothetical protein HDV02_000175 [Globomyces sp. JEL0801]